MSTSISTPALQSAAIVAEIAKDTTIPSVPTAFKARSDWIIAKRRAISRFAVASKGVNPDGTPSIDLTKVSQREQLKETNQLLNFLESDQFEMSARYKDTTKIDESLKVMFDMPKYHFPEEFKQRAEALYQKWESANWGETDDAAEGEEQVGGVATTTPVPASATAALRVQETRVYQPPEDHYIWGTRGIMHGVTIQKKGSKTSWVVNREVSFDGVKLSPGNWYFNQMVAMARKAHGHNQAGVSGDMSSGATSIVVSGAYRGVDDDRGDTIYYSNPGAQDNQDPNALSESLGRSLLDRSLQTGEPVRVLRAANASAFAPSIGIRYDGLYVVKARESPFKHNAKGGAYTRYVLERMGGQESLEGICKRSPTTEEKSLCDKVEGSWVPQ